MFENAIVGDTRFHESAVLRNFSGLQECLLMRTMGLQVKKIIAFKADFRVFPGYNGLGGFEGGLSLTETTEFTDSLNSNRALLPGHEELLSVVAAAASKAVFLSRKPWNSRTLRIQIVTLMAAHF